MARAGALDQRITFQSKTRTADGIGGSTVAWADLASDANVWAGVKFGGGGERFANDRVESRQTCTFTIRNRSDIDETMRIVWESTNYDIRSVNRMGSRALYLDIVAERGA